MRQTPPILDYRTRRPKAPAYDLQDVFTLGSLVGLSLVIVGCIYVFWAIFRYCTSAEPFSRIDCIVSLMVLAGSIVVGCSLRRLR
jgi:hypothetical protein